MAAEVGAHLSSMEFSNFYGMVPFGTSMDKNGFFVTASYWDHLGEPIHYHDLHQSRAELLGASLRGTITAQFTQFGEEVQPALRAAMPNFFMVTDKLGVDPFNERFPMDWVQEGTVRGTGGIHILDHDASHRSFRTLRRWRHRRTGSHRRRSHRSGWPQPVVGHCDRHLGGTSSRVLLR